MKFMNKALLVALFAMTAVSVEAISLPSLNLSWFSSKASEKTVAPAPVALPVKTVHASKFATAKEACVKALESSVRATKNGMKFVSDSAVNANNNVDSAIVSKVAWFKNHNATLQTSKAVVATAAVATVCYAMKKAYDAVQAYRAKKA